MEYGASSYSDYVGMRMGIPLMNAIFIIQQTGNGIIEIEGDTCS